MKVLSLLPLLAVSVAAISQGDIRAKLREFHQSSLYDGQVQKTPFSQSTYQTIARDQTATRYGNVNPAPSDEQLKNYYALACIFASTNGKPNPRAPLAEADIPKWKNSTGWVSDPDYCNWFGITCDNEGFVSQITLNNNSLYGTWPAETAFLGESLTAIDLFFNFFNYCETYEWFKSMNQLNYLFFGTTSWDSNGIPSVLKFLTNLFELDFSNTFWRGFINPDAFTGTKDLYYLDMGNNFYSLRNLDNVPPELYKLNIIRLFMDNIKITDGGSLNLSFLGEMPIILEFWADFTKFTGGIPASVGNALSLKSFSCTYCHLTGSIPAELAKTSLERMWLYANKLTGVVPGTLAAKTWLYLYVEENELTGTMPSGICDQVGSSLIELGADCELCGGANGGCCTCCGGEGCGNLEEVTPAPTAAPTGFVICFSGDSEVEVENQGPVKMSDLAIGDLVKVADNTFEPVYSFGHKSAEASADFLQISTQGNRKPLEISMDHMVVIEGGRNVPASMIKTGDNLVSATGDLVVVKNIRNVMRKGVYAPFTASGTIIVNDIVASNYVAFQGAEYLKVSGVETPFSYQWLAHIFNSVHRVAYSMGFTSETYTASGVSQWVNLPNQFGTWMLEQNFVVALGLLLPSIALFGFVSIIESLMNSPMTFATLLVGAVSMIAARRNVSLKLTANKV